MREEKGSATGVLMTVLLLAGLLALGIKYFNFNEALAPFARKWKCWLEDGALPTAGKLLGGVKEKGPIVAILYAHPGQCYGKDDLKEPGEIVDVGRQLALTLQEKGIETLHDSQSPAASYSEASSALTNKAEELKRQHPSLQVILDLHRDAAPEEVRSTYKLEVELGGERKELARLQLLLPSAAKDLGLFAGKIWTLAEERYPGLVRGISRTGGQGVLTVMVGDWQANNLADAKASARIFGELLAQVLD